MYIQNAGILNRAYTAVEHNALLSCYVMPFSSAGSNTVGSWIKNLLEQSGVDTSVFKVHSTRAASASKANQTARIDAALKHIGWSTKSTFCKFYEKPIVDIDSFQNAVLK